MRRMNEESAFTRFGVWIRQYCREDISVTDLDYVVEDYKAKKLFLLEEKTRGGRLHKAQKLTFVMMDEFIREAAPLYGYTYWGFYTLVMPHGATMPGPGMTLNGALITCEQLVAHMNFHRKFCVGMWPKTFAPNAGSPSAARTNA